MQPFLAAAFGFSMGSPTCLWQLPRAAAFFHGGISMLVLSRFKNEVLRIGDDIRIVVVEIQGDKVRLGIEAPRAISVHREEVYEAIQRGEKRPAKT